MKILIIEDETPAADKLERYLLKHDPNIEICAKLTSVETSVSWLRENQNSLDIIFMDIQLTDGLSFEIFSQLKVKKPVIFTTAYDEYAIDAFKVNSIDYLLKPLTFTDITNALKKLESLKESISNGPNINASIVKLPEKKYKDRFLVKQGNYIHSLKIEDVDFFKSDGRIVYLNTNAKKKYIIDYKMSELEDVLNNKSFYRVNRSFIVNINAIKNVSVFTNSRLQLHLLNTSEEIIVSRDRVGDFKVWLDR